MTRAARPARAASWQTEAIRRIEADYQRSADTHLIPLPLPMLAASGIDLYLKDESTHPTGSLKHRLARSLFLYALVQRLDPRRHHDRRGIERFDRSERGVLRTAAWPALRGGDAAPHLAGKSRADRFHGGECHFVDHASQVYDEARALAERSGGHYMDQFTYAERATDWRGNNNIAQSMFEQMAHERHPVPAWIVVGAGTGGTSATIGRYVRYRCHDTEVCVADPEGSVFGAYWRTGDASLTAPGSRIEGIGRPRVEASFIRTLVDRMIEVPNADSVAAMRALSALLGRKVGPSTGTNLVAMLALAHEMRDAGRPGAILSLLCDAGERYLPSYHDVDWVREAFGDVSAAERRIESLLK
jgi:cysteine synthase A